MSEYRHDDPKSDRRTPSNTDIFDAVRRLEDRIGREVETMTRRIVANERDIARNAKRIDGLEKEGESLLSSINNLALSIERRENAVLKKLNSVWLSVVGAGAALAGTLILELVKR